MAKSLFARQAKLLEYLTSGAAIFAEDNVQLDPALRGIGPGLLHLEAGLSHAKRIGKIAAILPRTFELLADDRAAILREFAYACPPAHVGGIENARQLKNFLCSRHDREPMQLPYLHEVAACELALVEVRVTAQRRERLADEDGNIAPGSIRRRPGIVLLRHAYDIQPVFASGGSKSGLSKRDTPLAIAMTPGAGDAKVFEVAPAVFDLLVAIHDWSDCAELGAASELKNLIGELVECGLVEVHP